MSGRCNDTSSSTRHSDVVALRSLSVVGFAVLLSACAHTSPRPGSFTGELPLCYGPGPTINLWRTATIETYQSGRLIGTSTFPSSNQHRTYTLTLAPGSYELRMPLRNYSLQIRVKPNSETKADWPQPSCL